MFKFVFFIGSELDYLEVDRNIFSDFLDYRKRRIIRLMKKNEFWGFIIQVRFSCIVYSIMQKRFRKRRIIINKGEAFEINYICVDVFRLYYCNKEYINWYVVSM